MKKTLEEQTQEINELGFDTPAIVDQEITKLITSFIKSPQFVKQVLKHAGFENMSDTSRISEIIDRRLNRIVRAIKEVPNRFTDDITDKFDELPNPGIPPAGLNESVQKDILKIKESMKKII